MVRAAEKAGFEPKRSAIELLLLVSWKSLHPLGIQSSRVRFEPTAGKIGETEPRSPVPRPTREVQSFSPEELDRRPGGVAAISDNEASFERFKR